MSLEYKTFEIEEVNRLFEGKSYNVVYMNYEMKNGIKKVVNRQNALKELEEHLKDFYKLYLFNKDRMITVYKFDKDNFQYMEVKSVDLEDVIKREYYLEDDMLQKLKVNIGYIVGDKEKKDNRIQAIHYIEFVEVKNNG